MKLRTKSIYHPKPFEPNQYIRPHVVDVVCLTDEGDSEEVIAGRVAVDYLDISRAETAGQSIVHVCDADSQNWEMVYSSTIEPAIDFAGIRKDFEFDDPVQGLIFIHQVVLHPSLRDWQQMILDSICDMFPNETATVMIRGITELPDRELAELGFRIVAGHDVLFRPNMLKYDYTTADDPRDPFADLIVPPDADAHVLDRWDLDDE
ncbi:hypothetical protein [Rhodopirellula bahusiensis]|uniref:Uncharacterized protein n=1 Tax=Rhodopirellula bahusiensis TaxID=2014065 RepID=A0A2G1VY86_9BACT|nr:hypothetical protein [Rhodopirellula bahusiensis]PHQ31695.1 hypothetical protein CEE69_29865 [Rhodopirellula bahusiensis]